MISIITPILNEKANIEPFLNYINKQEGDFELILVDGGSSDRTIDEISKNKSKFKRELKLIKTNQGRGHQMNKGAKAAKGDILLFLHVDSTIEKDTIPTIEKKTKKQKIIDGGLIQAFSNSDNFLRLASNFGNFRSRITKIFFGDSGIFIRKDYFNRIGGYDNIIFLEDVEFCKKAKKYGKLKQLQKTIITSPRRYHNQGKIKITMIFSIACLFNMVGFRPKFLIKFIIDK